MRVIALIALLFASPATAQDRVSILLGSHHIGASGFNERNPGPFFTWEDRGGFDLSFGAYVNSYSRHSIAATAAFPLVPWAEGEVSAFVGAAYYPQDGRRMRVSVGDVIPLAGVQVRHGPFFAQLIPMDGQPVDALVSFGLTFSLQ